MKLPMCGTMKLTVRYWGASSSMGHAGPTTSYSTGMPRSPAARHTSRVAGAPARRWRARSEEVLLDVHIDGRRYVLARGERSATEPRASLSPREKEIVGLVAKGLP